MEFNATVDLIVRELNEAMEIIEDLRNYKGVPHIQVELAKSKCRNAAEVIRLLKTIQEKDSQDIQETETAGNNEEPAPVSTRPAPADIKYELPSVKTLTPVREPQPIKEKPVKTTKKTSGKVTLADTFTRKSDSINEKLGVRKDDEGMRDLLKSKPITSLSEAIGINDKFLFIREIFNGNSDLYNKTIINLDNSSCFDDARTIIMDYTGNEENDVVRQLLELVKRKFPADE